MRLLIRTFTPARTHEPRAVLFAAVAAALLVTAGLLAAISGGTPDQAGADSAARQAISSDGPTDRAADGASRRDRPESGPAAKPPPGPAHKSRPAPGKPKPPHKPKPRKPGHRAAWVAPTSNFRISSGYGARWGVTHYGLDFAAPMGTKIVAAHSGVVSLARPHLGYGNTVVVSHGYGVRTLYAHNSTLLVKYGQRVHAGQPIALLGSTGDSTGPHLHFEVHHNNHAVDPRPWMAQRGLHF